MSPEAECTLELEAAVGLSANALHRCIATPALEHLDKKKQILQNSDTIQDTYASRMQRIPK